MEKFPKVSLTVKKSQCLESQFLCVDLGWWLYVCDPDSSSAKFLYIMD